VASAKEIRGQIKAIQNTAKITKAMELVAASKMKHAQDSVLTARAYEEGILRVVGNLMKAHPEFRHPFLVEREEVKRIGLLIISTDKGLCGGLNANAFRMTLARVKEFSAELEALSIGRRGAMFMRRIGVHLAGSSENIPDSPDLSDVLGVADLAMKQYLEGHYDEVYLIYSQFVNTMTQTPVCTRLLPCPVPEEKHEGYWDYIYEPEAKDVLEGILRRYVESLVYHSVLENKACEQSARMVAMKSATDNAKEIIKDLSITYNKARQAAITQELAEICAGAAAAQ